MSINVRLDIRDRFLRICISPLAMDQDHDVVPLKVVREKLQGRVLLLDTQFGGILIILNFFVFVEFCQNKLNI